MSEQPHEPHGPGAPAAPYQQPPPYQPATPSAPASERPAYQPPPSPYGDPGAGHAGAGQPYGAPSGQAPYGQGAYGRTPYGQAPYGHAAYGPAPYGPGAYGPPSPGAYGSYAPPPVLRTNGVAIAALVVGGLGLLLCAVPVIGALLGLAGVVLGIVGVRRAHGDMGGKGLAIGGLAAGGVGLLVGALVTTLFFAAIRSTQDTIDQAWEEIDQSQEEQDASATDQSSAIGSDEQAELDAATPLALGESAVVGEYTVTVTAIDTDADDVVAATDQYNAPPTHRYVLVDLTVTYAGEDVGDPFWDLDTAVLGTDGRAYSASSCWATLPQDPLDLEPVAAGATASYQVCMDVPAEVTTGAALRVEELFSFDAAAPAFWAVP
ncbi:hypothetical protein [Actinotalea solisilvae]|uniref:hypothetical protein n=1 Tax=Actinotalea solisilvae TaxID=2072922 RepID=UPI0018F1350E|nr:hypothetical protein [Actinotalea solisilvae]